MRTGFRRSDFLPRSLRCAALIACAFNLAGLVIAGTTRLNLRSRRSQRGVARTIYDPRCTWMAAVGRLDPAVLSFCRARRFEKPLVLVRLFNRSGRDAQGTAVVCSAFFCFLAALAKKMAQRTARARRIHSNGRSHSFTVAAAHPRGLGRISSGCWSQSLVDPAVQIPEPGRGNSRSSRVRRICNRCVHRRQLCMVASRFHLWQRTLPISFHQFVLQSCITSR